MDLEQHHDLTKRENLEKEKYKVRRDTKSLPLLIGCYQNIIDLGLIPSFLLFYWSSIPEVDITNPKKGHTSSKDTTFVW